MQPLIVIQNDGSEILTSNSFCLIKGEVGSGKSRLVMNMLVGLLNGEDTLGLTYTPCPPDKKILYFSTEMSKYHLQKRLLKILEQVSQDKEDLLMFWDLDTPDKLGSVNSACKEFPPYLIIIDQFADFIENINDIGNSTTLLSELNKIIKDYNCSIILIIHQNEDAGINAKARGHLGSFLEQKSVASLAIAQYKHKYKIKSTKLREGKGFDFFVEFDEQTTMFKKVVDIKETEENKKQKYLDILIDITFPISMGNFIDVFCKRLDKSESYFRKELLENILKENNLIKYKSGKFTMIKQQ
jgi:RecA-family ATPase